MTSSPSAPRSAIDYDAIDEEDLRKNAVNISILRASAFPEPIAALKSGITNIRHSEISENFVRTLGHSTTAADGTLKKIIQLTWRYKGKSSHEDFRIVAAGRYDVVLGEDACLKLADVGRRIQPLMIDSGDPGSCYPVIPFDGQLH